MIAALTLALLQASMQPTLTANESVGIFDRIVADKLSFHHAQEKPPSAAKSKRAEIKAKFEELNAKNDRAGCLTLWKENPDRVLQTIDADLEGSMRVFESGGDKPDLAKIDAMHKRALWGAEIAVEATGHPIILDYASSFVGWNKDQRAQFRAGQAVYKKSVDAESKGDHKVALEAGRECVDRASALGDWWGAAMGYEASGTALQSIGDFDNALVAYSRARVLNHDLGLSSDEYSNTRSMIDMCYSNERWSRGRACTNEALAMARKRGDKDAIAELLKRRASFEDRLGDKAASEASKKEAEGLK